MFGIRAQYWLGLRSILCPGLGGGLWRVSGIDVVVCSPGQALSCEARQGTACSHAQSRVESQVWESLPDQGTK